MSKLTQVGRVIRVRPARVRREWVRVEPRRRSSLGDRWRCAGQALRLGVWFGLIAALGETLTLGGLVLAWGKSILGWMQLNRHVWWTVGVANLIILASAGGICAVVAWIHPRSATLRVAFFALASLAMTSCLLIFQSLSALCVVIFSCGIAAALVRRVNPSGARFKRWVGTTLPPLALFPLVLFGYRHIIDSQSERAALMALPAPPRHAPNVVLVVLDTVRADALSCYGYNRRTTPNLDRLARRGVRYSQARSSASWTLPSHATMFTGRWPHELSARLETPLDGAHPTLAEHLARSGYATVGCVANSYYCNAWQGLGRGFIAYRDTALTLTSLLRSSGLGRKLVYSLGMRERLTERPKAVFPRKDADDVNREFFAWLESRDRSRPFFAFLNYFDAHDPYLSDDEPEDPCGARPRSKLENDRLRDWHLCDKSKLSPREVQLARDCYDDCLRELDSRVGALLADLDREGISDNTLFVITSDHGEQFGDHGAFGHGTTLYASVTHVPLLVVPPIAAAPERETVEEPVSLADLAKTVAELATPGVASPFPGRPWPGLGLKRLGPATPVFSEILDRERSETGPWKPGAAIVEDGFVYMMKTNGEEELYRTAEDPDEATNLAHDPAFSAKLAELRARTQSIATAGN